MPPSPEDKKMVVPVMSNRGAITIPVMVGGDDSARRRVDLQLSPGPNLVPADLWELAKRQPGVRRLMSCKIPSVRAPEQPQNKVGKPVIEEGKPVPASAPLAGMSDTDAIELVKDSYDAGLLNGLLKTEARAPVRRAIQARLEELKDPAKAASLAEAAAGSSKASITLG